MSEDYAPHEQLADGLTALAEFIRANPELADDLRYPFDRVHVPINTDPDPRARLAVYARAAKAAGAEVTKSFDDAWAGLDLAFGDHVRLSVYADRGQVCERRVVGIRQVTKEVPDPDAPRITVTVDQEIVEWECTPLLADEAGVS